MDAVHAVPAELHRLPLEDERIVDDTAFIDATNRPRRTT